LEVKLSEEGIDNSPSDLNNKLKSLYLQNIFSQPDSILNSNDARILVAQVGEIEDVAVIK
jgi:hypothetical protein